MSARCEPPEELRGVDGWHWLITPDGKEIIGRWHLNGDGETWLWAMPGGAAGAAWAARKGFRYLAPVATPAEVAALRRWWRWRA